VDEDMAKKDSDFQPRLGGTLYDKWDNTNGNNFGEIISPKAKAAKKKAPAKGKKECYPALRAA
jgi:hypothetical protein